jgi:hypothetical protein
MCHVVVTWFLLFLPNVCIGNMLCKQTISVAMEEVITIAEH